MEERKEENGKNESPFSALVKLSTGKNPTTFSLPPELKCNTIFPGKQVTDDFVLLNVTTVFI